MKLSSFNFASPESHSSAHSAIDAIKLNGQSLVLPRAFMVVGHPGSGKSEFIKKILRPITKDPAVTYFPKKAAALNAVFRKALDVGYIWFDLNPRDRLPFSVELQSFISSSVYLLRQKNKQTIENRRNNVIVFFEANPLIRMTSDLEQRVKLICLNKEPSLRPAMQPETWMRARVQRLEITLRAVKRSRSLAKCKRMASAALDA